MKYRERDKLVTRLRELADFIEQRGLTLPGVHHIPTIHLYLTATDYVKDPETGEWDSVLDEAKTKQNLKRALAALGSCEKDYQEDRIELRKRFSDGSVMVRATVDRSLACKRVVVGQKLQQAVYTPSKLVDEVEWQCDEGLSLLELVKDV